MLTLVWSEELTNFMNKSYYDFIFVINYCYNKVFLANIRSEEALKHKWIT